MFNPDLVADYKSFTYKKSLASLDFGSLSTANAIWLSNSKNIEAWTKHLNYNGGHQAIDYILNFVSPEEFEEFLNNTDNKITKNPFIEFLKKNHHTEEINYLKFAKKCEIFNNKQEGWEEGPEEWVGFDSLLIEGEKLHLNCKNSFLKIRYAFQIVRLSRYGYDDKVKCKYYFEKYLQPLKEDNIIKYWAMDHYAFSQSESDPNYSDYLYSIIFDRSVDKKLLACKRFKGKNLPEVLKFAKNNHEKAAILSISAIQNPGRGLNDIRKIYSLDPYSSALQILLLREVNKIEDWIFTPELSLLRYPSYNYRDREQESQKLINFKKDIFYLRELRSFLEGGINNSKIANPSLWNTIVAYLYFVDHETEKAKEFLNVAKKAKGLTGEIEAQIHIINIECHLLKESKPDASLEDELLKEFQWLEKNQNQIYDYKKSYGRLMMVLSNKYKKNGNIIMAALCQTKVQGFLRLDEKIYSKYEEYEFIDFKSCYDFLDDEASVYDLKKILNFLDKTNKTLFEQYMSREIIIEKNRIIDLLGTKYMRLNQLTEADKAFKLLPASYWESDNEHYKTYLNANPFYTNFYNEHYHTKADTIRFTKLSIADSLIKVINRAENPKEMNRAKWYLLAGNCYLNMSYWGNSWIMMQNSSSKAELYYKAAWQNKDKNVYYECSHAKELYLKAYQYAKNKKSKAFCLRMAARCESYKNLYNESKKENIYMKQLKNEYQDYYEELAYQCTSFDEYYKVVLEK